MGLTVNKEMRLMRFCLLAAAFALAIASGPPPFFEKAATARWLVHKLNYAVLSTTSASLDQAPFGNPQSFSDGAVDDSTGRPFFYVSSMDASMQDVAADPKCSLTLSLQMLDDYCTKEWAPLSGQIDPEDPRCTRLTLVGTMRNVTTQELPFAQAAMFDRHPETQSWPKSHDFHVVTMDIEDIWLIDMFGGASLIKLADYFGAPPSTADYLKAPLSSDAALFPPTVFEPPAYTDKAKTARWLAHNLTFGVLSTMSQQYKGY